jgi:hypothetical protein
MPLFSSRMCCPTPNAHLRGTVHSRKAGPRPRTPEKKGLGIVEAPFYLLLRCVEYGNRNHIYCWPRFFRNSHRKSGVFSFVALLSPVESSIPSEALESSQLPCTPRR